MSLPSESPPRFFGMDIHRDYAVVLAVASPHTVVLPARRIDFSRFEDWIKKHLLPSDHVAIEATVNAWLVHDLVAPLVSRCVVTDARQVRLISHAAVKTDAQDALRLANLLSVNMLPIVWVPPPHVRDLRALAAHRSALIKRRTIALNRIRSLINRHNLQQPDDLLSPNDWLDDITAQLSPVEQLLVRDDLESLVPLAASVTRVEAQMAHLSQSDAWRTQSARVMQLLGFGIVHAMTLLGAIGDISRFPSADKFCGYTGLCSKVDQSGQKDRSGPISKAGRRDLRNVFVEAARSSVRYDTRFKREFDDMCKRMHPHKAIVAVARKLAALVWYMLHEPEPARHMTDQQRAFKFASIHRQLAAHDVAVPPTRYFIRQQLRAIGRSDDTTSYNIGKRPRIIATDLQLAEFEARFATLPNSASPDLST